MVKTQENQGCVGVLHRPNFKLLIVGYLWAMLDILRCWTWGGALLATLFLWNGAHAKGFEDSMAERTRACTACHGEQGRAGPDGYYPRLAGKPAGYLYNQLKNFAEGRRHYGLMTRLVDPLSDAYLREMAQYFSNLKLPYPAPMQNASRLAPALLAQGQQLALRGDATRQLPACMQCHGERLTGVQPHVPGLLGLPLDYLNAQLGAWQTHQRQAMAPDCMAQVVQRMNSSDLIAVATWLSIQSLPADSAPQAAPKAASLAAPLPRCGSAPELQP
jgi:cytochrome c553